MGQYLLSLQLDLYIERPFDGVTILKLICIPGHHLRCSEVLFVAILWIDLVSEG